MERVHKDFHGALSCGFKYIAERYGKESLIEFLKQVAYTVYGDLIQKIKKEGLKAVEEYWREIFEIEEGKVEIKRNGNKEIVMKVKECPALSHLKKRKYPVYSDFCIQCKIINVVIGEKTGFSSEVISYQQKSRCVQKFWKEK